MSSTRDTPSKAEIDAMPPFPALGLANIRIPASGREFADAAADLLRCRYIGFDTESKPCFKPGELSDGPHVVQLTTLETAYLFQLHQQACHAVVAAILESSKVIKVGFGLKSDRGHLLRKLGIRPRALLDMNQLFRSEGYRKEMGVKAAVAVVLERKFQKPKRVSTSNWALAVLKPNQLLYAANDAFAALKVLEAMHKPEAELLALLGAAQTR